MIQWTKHYPSISRSENALLYMGGYSTWCTCVQSSENVPDGKFNWLIRVVWTFFGRILILHFLSFVNFWIWFSQESKDDPVDSDVSLWNYHLSIFFNLFVQMSAYYVVNCFPGWGCRWWRRCRRRWWYWWLKGWRWGCTCKDSLYFSCFDTILY